MHSLPLRLSSFLLLIPWLLSAQKPVYYVDTLSVGTLERPIALQFYENLDDEGIGGRLWTDSLYFSDPVYQTLHYPYAYSCEDDTIIIYKNKKKYFGYFTAERDTLYCKFLGEELCLIKVNDEPDFIRRPQESKISSSHAHRGEEIRFQSNGESVQLAGTLMLPETINETTPCVILLAGSGFQNRNSEVFGHKIFLVLSDYLAEHGIASFRYDKRGVGESEGDFSSATISSFVRDAEGAVNYLCEHYDFSSLGVLGHSEGGMVASELCKNNKDIDFYVLIGAPAVRIDALLYDQSRRIMEAAEMKPKLIAATLEFNKEVYKLMAENMAIDSLPKYLNPLIEEFRNTLDSTDRAKAEYSELSLYFSTAQSFYGDYIHSFITFPAEKNFTFMRKPTLAIYGDKDLQVSAELNLPSIKRQLEIAPVEKFTILEFPDCNHLMQPAETGSPGEYVYIPTTIAPEVLNSIVEWIQNLSLK